jgi:hypothetical protein
LRVLAGRWRGGRLTLFCDADGVRIRMPQEWTDRGPEPAEEPVSVETLAALRAVLDAMMCRGPDSSREGESCTPEVDELL